MNRFAVVLLVLGLSACASTRQEAARLTQQPGDDVRAMALAMPTPSEGAVAAAPPTPATIRARGLLDPAELARVSRKAGGEISVMGAGARAALPLTPRNINEIRIHSLPVGAGSCHLIECPGPGNELLLYDCGSTEGARAHFGLDEVRAYLAEVAGGRPLKVVVSHADRDHYSHVPELVAPARVQTLWLGGFVSDYPVTFRTWVAAVQDAQAEGTGEVAADLPAGWSNEGYAVAPLQCGSALSYVVTVGVGDEKNDHSLVLSIDHGSFRVLLTGDATGETQNSAMANFPSPYLDATVVTAAHHGAESHGSNAVDWVEAVRPEIVIYSAGEGHAHPRCPVVENYRGAGSLLPASRHNLRCGTRYGYEAAQPTFLSEYNTFDSGAIVVTSGPALDALRVECVPEGVENRACVNDRKESLDALRYHAARPGEPTHLRRRRGMAPWLPAGQC